MASHFVELGARTPTMMRDFVRRWVQHCRHTLQGRTQSEYVRRIWRLVNAFAPTMLLQDVTREHLERFIDSVVFAEGLKPSSANAYVTVFKSFYRWIEDEYDLPNPARRLKFFKAIHQQRILSESEYAKILAVATPFEKDILELIANTGMRVPSELHCLLYDHAVIADDLSYIIIKGKGNKERAVPLNKTAQKVIRKYLQPDNSLKLSKSVRGKNTVLAMCYRVSKRAHIRRFGPHALRHRFATRLMLCNVSMPKISKVLGHSHTRTTEEVYCHWTSVNDVLGVSDVLDEK